MNRMSLGDIVCVCLEDRETLKDLELIIERSRDKILKQEQEADTYRIYMQKG